MTFSGADIFLFVIGFFLPPLPQEDKLQARENLCTKYKSRPTTIIGLTLLGHVPGIVYAWYIVYKNRDDPNTERRHGHAYTVVPQQQQPNYQATAPAPAQYPVN
ncbi:hypothetical protein BGX26_000439 [Mortierella sp. AD094]|nr:hypothetical protein BGX26_000439 [Mortierella sp. AD094]